MSHLILIVEDEQDLLHTLDYSLRKAGHRTRLAGTGMAALEHATQEPLPDLVVLDLMLPDMEGTEVCRRLRGFPATRKMPVLMLTAKGEEGDRVGGFESGADDYMVKPFSVRELLLRINAILRRSGQPATAPASAVFGNLRVDPAGQKAWVEERDAGLTHLEFRLLNYLLERRGRVQTRDVLLKEVWGGAADVQSRTVDVHVNRLREKLGSAGAFIETLRGAGYRFRAQPGRGAAS
ncbi:MAG: response regulator transcription factor [Magnetococcales bacterium]|nr:response regulator transcription factor [Magnetococcales bacterium]